MGVPVVTLAGKIAVRRAGASLLTQVGLEGLIAPDRNDYVEVARALGSDLDSLAELRKELRGMMQASDLMNKKSFAHDVEEAYRAMWRGWCATAG
jgi:protein O-GlcNAc transferase